MLVLLAEIAAGVLAVGLVILVVGGVLALVGPKAREDLRKTGGH